MNKEWIKAALIRATRTFFQVFASFITVGAALDEVSWGYVASVSAVAAIYSLATSFAGLPEVEGEVSKYFFLKRGVINVQNNRRSKRTNNYFN